MHIAPGHECCRLRAVLAPQSVRLFTGLPQFDRAVFAAGREDLAVGRKGRGPDRTVMTLQHFCSLIRQRITLIYSFGVLAYLVLSQVPDPRHAPTCLCRRR